MSSAAKIVLLSSQVVTVTTSGDPVSLSQTSQRFIGFLKNSAVASGNYTVKIQHSPNKIDWFDLVSFTAVNAPAVAGAEQKQVTDNVFVYVRATVTVAAGVGDGTLLVELHFQESK